MWMDLESAMLSEVSHKEKNVCAQSLQSCSTLCNPMDCSPPGSSVHGILHARILEWAAMPSPKGMFLTQRSNLSLQHLTQILYH